LDHHYESNPESEVGFEIESNLEASQVPSAALYQIRTTAINSTAFNVLVCVVTTGVIPVNIYAFCAAEFLLRSSIGGEFL